jgi:hypothetical protein
MEIEQIDNCFITFGRVALDLISNVTNMMQADEPMRISASKEKIRFVSLHMARTVYVDVVFNVKIFDEINCRFAQEQRLMVHLQTLHKYLNLIKDRGGGKTTKYEAEFVGSDQIKLRSLHDEKLLSEVQVNSIVDEIPDVTFEVDTYPRGSCIRLPRVEFLTVIKKLVDSGAEDVIITTDGVSLRFQTVSVNKMASLQMRIYLPPDVVSAFGEVNKELNLCLAITSLVKVGKLSKLCLDEQVVIALYQDEPMFCRFKSKENLTVTMVFSCKVQDEDDFI